MKFFLYLDEKYKYKGKTTKELPAYVCLFFSSFYNNFFVIFLCRVDWGPVKNKSESGKSTRLTE